MGGNIYICLIEVPPIRGNTIKKIYRMYGDTQEKAIIAAKVQAYWDLLLSGYDAGAPRKINVISCEKEDE